MSVYAKLRADYDDLKRKEEQKLTRQPVSDLAWCLGHLYTCAVDFGHGENIDTDELRSIAARNGIVIDKNEETGKYVASAVVAYGVFETDLGEPIVGCWTQSDADANQIEPSNCFPTIELVQAAIKQLTTKVS